MGHNEFLPKGIVLHVPMQEVPFPLHPSLQVHTKLPTVLVQVALSSSSQLSTPERHSSISAGSKMEGTYYSTTATDHTLKILGGARDKVM